MAVALRLRFIIIPNLHTQQQLRYFCYIHIQEPQRLSLGYET